MSVLVKGVLAPVEKMLRDLTIVTTLAGVAMQASVRRHGIKSIENMLT